MTNGTTVELPFTFQHLSLTGGLRSAVERNPTKTALRLGDKTRTYGELMERIDKITAAFIGDLGLSFGDHGAIEHWRREQARAVTAARRPDLPGVAHLRPDHGETDQ